MSYYECECAQPCKHTVWGWWHENAGNRQSEFNGVIAKKSATRARSAERALLKPRKGERVIPSEHFRAVLRPSASDANNVATLLYAAGAAGEQVEFSKELHDWYFVALPRSHTPLFFCTDKAEAEEWLRQHPIEGAEVVRSYEP